MAAGSHQADFDGWESTRARWLPAVHLTVVGVFSGLPLSYYRLVAWPWVGLWQVGWLLLLGWGMARLRQRHHPFYRLGHGLDGWLVALGLALILSGGFSAFPRVALWNVSLALSYGLGLYAYRNWVNQNGLPRQRLWLGLVALAAGVATISLALWRPDSAMWQAQNVLTALRNHQPLGHHNFVGGYFALMLPLAVAAAIATKGWPRYLAGLSVVLISLALYVSGSRGAALGAAIWFLIAWLARLSRTERQHRWRWGVAGAVSMTLVGLTLATNPRIRAWLNPASAVTTDGPALDRWFMLRLGGHILQDRPLLGVGPGVMSRVSNLYRPIETGAGLDHIQQLHNTPLQLAGELGLPGLALYLIGLFLVGRLWWRLWQCPLTLIDRALLGGLGGGLLAYGVSSLTDYQLENIPIATTLLLMVALLLALADAYGLPKNPLSWPCRRWASLVVWVWLGLLVYIWLPFTLTIGFGAWADGAFYSQHLNQADTHWQRALRLSPWDPTAPAVASEALHRLDQVLGDSEAKDNVRSLLLDYAHQAQQAAPNDTWFNQNLAVLHQKDDPAQALPYAARAVQLMPRNRNYGYWLLGELLEAEGQRQGAIAAFTLEALVNPAALTLPLWQKPPLQALYPAVVDQTLAEYDQLLAQMDELEFGVNTVYETRVVLGWWTGHPLPTVQPERLRPMVQALLMADTNPQAALNLVENTLAAGSATSDLQLLAAWLNPSVHWETYANPGGSLSEPDRVLIEESLFIQPLRLWLTAITTQPRQPYRSALAFAYRNYQARQITLMLQPDHLQVYSLIDKLELFQPWPREFPKLDRRIETLRTQTLGLPHPTQHHFRLSTLSSPSSP